MAGMGENPMMSEPNLNEAHKHMQQLEFVACQDLFINESGAYADVFLPATTFAEKDGTFTNTDRRVQIVRKAITPFIESFFVSRGYSDLSSLWRCVSF